MAPLFKAAISDVLQQLIHPAQEQFPDHLEHTLQVKAHDIQGVATSLLWSTNKAFLEVLVVAYWRTQSVFTTHYLS